MFEKIFNSLFVKTSKKSSGITVMSGKRDMQMFAGAVKKSDLKAERSDVFWNNRGRAYGALFTSLNGRSF